MIEEYELITTRFQSWLDLFDATMGEYANQIKPYHLVIRHKDGRIEIVEESGGEFPSGDRDL